MSFTPAMSAYKHSRVLILSLSCLTGFFSPQPGRRLYLEFPYSLPTLGASAPPVASTWSKSPFCQGQSSGRFRLHHAFLGHVLLHIYCVEAQSIEQSGDAGPGVLAGFVENPVVERGLGNLLFGGQANFGFQVQVGADQETGRPGVDP